MTASQGLEAGTKVGRYTIVRVVGSGANGVVYEARDDGLGRPVAVKVIEGNPERARREARVIGALHHPNIVGVLDVVEHAGRVGIVQEWVPGPSLEQLLVREGTLPIDEVVGLGLDLSRGLAHAHGHGVLHRDLKPSNVLRGAEGFRLTDFGAFGTMLPDSTVTRSGEIAGTPLWMSPEQITGEPQSVASDVYGLGLLLFRCLHGTVPAEESSSYLELMRHRTGSAVVVPASPLQGLLRQCLAREPSARPASAEAVLVSLQQALVPSVRAPSPEPLLAPDEPSAVSAEAPGRTTAAAPPARAADATRWALIALPLAVATGLFVALWTTLGPAVAVSAVVAVVVLVAGLMLAQGLRRRWREAEPRSLQRASAVLTGQVAPTDLSSTLMRDLAELTSQLKGLGAAVLGHTVIALAREYEQATDPATRIAVLQQLLAIQERIEDELTPWYVKQREPVALLISAISCLASVAAVVVAATKG